VLVAHNNRVSFNSNQNQLLGRLAPKQLEQLLPHLEAIDAPQRQVLQRRGERVDFVHFPETAVVSFVVALEDGHTVEVGMVGREGLVGIGVLLKDGDRGARRHGSDCR
jgi:CRP-like cAMP-binding protein